MSSFWGNVCVCGLGGMEMSDTQSIYSLIIFQYNSRLMLIFLSFEWQRQHWLVVNFFYFFFKEREGVWKEEIEKRGNQIKRREAREGKKTLKWWRKKKCKQKKQKFTRLVSCKGRTARQPPAHQLLLRTTLFWRLQWWLDLIHRPTCLWVMEKTGTCAGTRGLHTHTHWQYMQMKMQLGQNNHGPRQANSA